MSRGDRIVSGCLRDAREYTNDARLKGRSTFAAVSHFYGLLQGKMIVAEVWLDADPLLAQAATNEITFLFGDYLSGAA